MTSQVLTPWIIETIQKGDAILFLGAGASFGAKGAKGETAPSGEHLRDILCDRFLGGALKTKPLAQVAELAKNEAGLQAVQEVVRDLFIPLAPASFHQLIASFRWFSIVTTNFDLVLERAYDAAGQSAEQQLVPIYRDGDNFSYRLRDPSKVVYVKLHGCITHISDENLPLILASEEYAKHRKNRERLFKHFQDWGRERPIIFCGYDVGDPNIQQILFDLADLGMRRPLYGLVNPRLDEISVRYWSAKRFAVTVQTFEDFLKALDGTIPKPTRGLAALVKHDEVSLRPWIKAHFAPSSGLLRYLQDELIHVRKSMPTQGVNAQAFYRGLTSDWGAFQQDLDVRRRVADDIILEVFLNEKKKASSEAFVLKGHAGSGKSISLRRVAWDVAHLFDGLVFHLNEGAVLRREHLRELYSLVGQRIYIVIDDALRYTDDIQEVCDWSERTATPVTLLFGARTNEWNIYGQDLDARLTNEYEVKDLTPREIAQLIQKLDQHRALGRLTNASQQEREAHFQLTAERQLLVALHDISAERSFEEIVFDEYQNIQPAEAKVLYLDVCTLHRLGVGVRAGLISRISGISFEYFATEFFKPLEHVVRTYFDHTSRDNMYRSRHPLIAEIVFKQALPDAGDRTNQIIRLIRNMDVDYASDESAFKQMVRGRALAELFQNKMLVSQIFTAALESGAPASYVDHQRAVFELHHPNGNLDRAMEAINRAEGASEHPDRSILHTKASILRQLALNAPQRLVRDKYRDEAKAILHRQLRAGKVSHSYSTAALLLLDELKDKAKDTPDEPTKELHARAMAETIRQVEETLHEGLQRFPGDEFLLSLEAELGTLLKDTKRAFDALTRAFEANPGRAFIAIRLARNEFEGAHHERAFEVLKKSLAANPQSHEVHLTLAKLEMALSEKEYRDDIAYHLKRSFTPGDSNLDAQFWYARHNFLFGDKAAAMNSFRELASARVSPEHRNRVRDVLRENANVKRYSGHVKSVKDYFCFLTCPELGAELFAHSTQFREKEWASLSNGDAVAYEVGFALRGPLAMNVRVKV